MSVRGKQKNGVFTLSIDVPEDRNALDLETVADLRKALAKARDDKTLRLVVLESGVDRVFSLGMNLTKLDSAVDEGVWTSFGRVSSYADLLIDLATMPVTSIAVVNGVAAGGGVELACVCDTVIGSSQASFQIAQLRNGIFPFITSAVIVPRIGQARFIHWALSGQTLPAKRLFELGLVNQLCEPDDLDRTVSVFVERVLGFDSDILRAGIASLRTDAEPEIRGRIRHALSMFTLNCIARRGRTS
jgi:enoyl-CoA hydratase/carnithine racemase